METYKATIISYTFKQAKEEGIERLILITKDKKTIAIVNIQYAKNETFLIGRRGAGKVRFQVSGLNQKQGLVEEIKEPPLIGGLEDYKKT